MYEELNLYTGLQYDCRTRVSDVHLENVSHTTSQTHANNDILSSIIVTYVASYTVTGKNANDQPASYSGTWFSRPEHLRTSKKLRCFANWCLDA